jgi:hypothetical protein
MAGWHVDNQPFTLPVGHSLERFGHNLVVTPAYKLWPALIHEPHERILGKFLLQHLFPPVQVLQNNHFLRVGQLI